MHRREDVDCMNSKQVLKCPRSDRSYDSDSQAAGRWLWD